MFAIVVFSGLWLLLADIVWRLNKIRIRRFALAMSAAWAAGIVLIVAGFYLAGA